MDNTMLISNKSYSWKYDKNKIFKISVNLTTAEFTKQKGKLLFAKKEYYIKNKFSDVY